MVVKNGKNYVSYLVLTFPHTCLHWCWSLRDGVVEFGLGRQDMYSGMDDCVANELRKIKTLQQKMVAKHVKDYFSHLLLEFSHCFLCW